MKVGYIRSFSKGDSLDRLSKLMEKEGVKKIIVEVSSEEKNYQAMLLKSISDMTKEDVLVVKNLDELGDTVADVMEILKKLEINDVGLQVIDTPFEDENINDSKVQRLLRKQLLAVLVWVENKEREDISRMQANAVKMLKETKQKKGSGRPKKYAMDAKDPEDREAYYNVVNMLKNDIPIKRIADTLNIARNTIYTIKEEIEEHTDSDM